MIARRACVVGALAASLTTACRHAAPSPAPSTAQSAASIPREAVTVRVANHYRADVVIYVLHGNVRARLGTVVTAATTTFTLARSYVGDAGGFVLIADAVGGPGTRSDRVIVHGGERIEWSLESDLARSSLAIY